MTRLAEENGTCTFRTTTYLIPGNSVGYYNVNILEKATDYEDIRDAGSWQVLIETRNGKDMFLVESREMEQQ